ncbi:hypothetical protein TWF696_005459 [Orbilia brochopaga]|uniref:Low temperature viability protein n=1 Tax=Orbilia brochopaga TaxID=3140254 RepID=A0AAV9V0Z4_9PEZI
MPRRKWIDKKSAQTFSLVHRSQQDPLTHDPDASQMVFKEIITPNTNTPVPEKPPTSRRHRPAFSSASSAISDLDSQYGSQIRKNEGEAALYGIYYDDTEYDYMQHMRDIGVSSEAVFIEAPQAQSKQRKHKAPIIPESSEEGEAGIDRKKTLEELLEEDSAAKNGGNTRRVQLPAEMLPSGGHLERTYRDQQDVPDTIAGFQPDMDPRLKEVLTALDDDAYVSKGGPGGGDDDEDFFSALAKSGEVDEFEFERTNDFPDDEDDDGWESDATEKPERQIENTEVPDELPDPALVAADAEVTRDWQEEFAKFKKHETEKSTIAFSAYTATGRSAKDQAEFAALVYAYKNHKLKKKGVPHAERIKLIPTTFNLSSSALPRTEAQKTLDARFEQIQKEYARDDDEDDELASRSSIVTPGYVRPDFDQIMDDFLNEYHVTGKGKNRRVRKGKPQTGLEQLDEIRQELGRPKAPSRS